MQNPQHLSMKPLRITDGRTIRREIFNLAQPSDSPVYRLVKAVSLFRIDLPDFFSITPAEHYEFTRAVISRRE